MLVDSSTTPGGFKGRRYFVLWTQNLTPHVDQGLWIQVPVLHYYCAKAASSINGFFLTH